MYVDRFEDGSGEKTLAVVLFAARPSGWYLQDKVGYCRRVQTLIDAIDMNRRVINKTLFEHEEREDQSLKGTLRLFYLPFALRYVTIEQSVGKTVALAETNQRLARLACRLEEYRIARGYYPEKLDELPDLPAHLNQEVLSELPLQYHRKGDTYQLYSTGWEQKDHGGNAGTDMKAGDWIWPSP